MCPDHAAQAGDEMGDRIPGPPGLDSVSSLSRGRVVTLVPLLIGLLMWGSAVTATLLIGSTSVQVEKASVRAPAVTLVTVGSSNSDMAEVVRVTLRTAETRNVLSVTSGIVTGLPVAVGARFDDGEKVITIDGITRVAQVGGTPFYRDLQQGDTGDDVVRLAQLVSLSVQGLTTDDSASYTAGLAAAVDSFETGLGRLADGRFHMEDALYVPDGFGTVVRIGAAVGDRVSTGSTLFTEGARVLSADIRRADGRPSEITEVNGAVILTFDATSIELGAIDVATEFDKAALTPLADKRAVLGTTTIEVDNVTIRLKTPVVLATAPRTTLFTDTTGLTCLIVLAAGVGSTLATGPYLVPADLPASPSVATAFLPASLAGSTVAMAATVAPETSCV